eukprot:TRINITY_DN2398_c0_g1_i7.p1 TRINITY_DN2398_c0_g1~~TRINITY_DN2398_c0_g1_i7.p1  ORF type:complete len:172 (+),score=35.53 TRINITY_DN2398_c0_g1_i7:430-945(+)
MFNLRDDETGREILRDKPRINQESIKFNELKKLPPNSLGYKYYEFMSSHEFTPDERPLVKYIPDFEIAYIYQRYKEIHDFLHTILFTNVALRSEVLIKWFEMVQLGLPSAILSSFGGLTLLGREDTSNFLSDLTRTIGNAHRCPFVMNIYWEKLLNEDIDKLRSKWRIRAV